MAGEASGDSAVHLASIELPPVPPDVAGNNEAIALPNAGDLSPGNADGAQAAGEPEQAAGEPASGEQAAGEPAASEQPAAEQAGDEQTVRKKRRSFAPDEIVDGWRCPAPGCGHLMQKASAGRRVHMRKHHPELCPPPCTCAKQACTTCVPESCLFSGQPWNGSASSSSSSSPNPRPPAAAKAAAAKRKSSEGLQSTPAVKSAKSGDMQNTSAEKTAKSNVRRASTAPLKEKDKAASPACLDDAPPDHRAHRTFNEEKLGKRKRCFFVTLFEKTHDKPVKVKFRFTAKDTGGCQKEMLRIARLCYVKWHESDRSTLEKFQAAKVAVDEYKASLVSSSRGGSSQQTSNCKALCLIKNKARRFLGSPKRKRAQMEQLESAADETPVRKQRTVEADIDWESIKTKCELDAVKLKELLMDRGANMEITLRGVEPELQEQVLAACEEAVQKKQTVPSGEESCEVALGPSLSKDAVEGVDRSGQPDDWATEALSRGANWPERSSRAPLPSGFDVPKTFSLGVVVGPTGSGVTRMLMTLASHLDLSSCPAANFESDKTVASEFIDAASILPMVGLNSVPAWMRPYHVLSNGQQQRVRLAKGLCSGAVIDDFGSGIDQQEVNSVAHSLSKFIKRERLSNVLIGTHSPESVSYLQPDFVIWSTGEFSTNPNPQESRSATIRLEPCYMGKLGEESDINDASVTETGQYVHKSSAAWPDSIRVKRRTLEISVQTDERTIDAANAFELEFDGNARCSIPVLPRQRLSSTWQMGLVVGPSGTGKTTTIRDLLSTMECPYLEVRDDVPSDDVSIFSHVAKATKDADVAAQVLEACCVPKKTWLCTFSCLSRSEAWRASLALNLAFSQNPETLRQSEEFVVVVDEFTTQLDRAHAKELAQSLRDYIHDSGVRLVCATVHTDVAAWLHPNWVFDTGFGEFALTTDVLAEDLVKGESDPAFTCASLDPESLWMPPLLTFDVRLVDPDTVQALWKDQFKHHHYLTGSLDPLKEVAVVQERSSRSLAAFHACNMLPGSQSFVREHRLVVHPSWQGFGLGPKLSKLMAHRWTQFHKGANGSGYRFNSKTAHPRLGAIRQMDPCWRPTVTSNLRTPDTDFGDIGFKKKKRNALPQLELAHGTKVRISKMCSGTKFQLSAYPPTCLVEVDIELPPPQEVKSVGDRLGITFIRDGSLTVDKFRHGGGLPPPRYNLGAINGEKVESLEQASEILSRWAHVHSMSFLPYRPATSSSYCRAPRRPTEKVAEADINWFRERSVATANLSDELEQVQSLLKQLSSWTGKQQLFDSPSEKNPPLRPDTPELPLKILPSLKTFIEKHRPQQKLRICYGHVYYGPDEPLPDTVSTRADRYQVWMRLRVPELQKAGKTHMAAVATGMAEWPKNDIAEFSWSCLQTASEPEKDPEDIVGVWQYTKGNEHRSYEIKRVGEALRYHQDLPGAGHLTGVLLEQSDSWTAGLVSSDGDSHSIIELKFTKATPGEGDTDKITSKCKTPEGEWGQTFVAMREPLLPLGILVDDRLMVWAMQESQYPTSSFRTLGGCHRNIPGTFTRAWRLSALRRGKIVHKIASRAQLSEVLEILEHATGDKLYVYFENDSSL